MRILAVLAALALGSGVVCARDRPTKPPPSAPKPAARRPAPVQPNRPPASKLNQQPARQNTPKQLERLERMSPSERQQMLQHLPSARAHRLQEQLNDYERLSPEQRGRLKQQYDQFRQLPPARQEAIRNAFQRLGSLPPDRQEAVRQEFNTLHSLSENERRERIKSGEFRSRFDKHEQKLIEEMSKAVPE